MMPALPQARDCGKIILKLFNHLATIILPDSFLWFNRDQVVYSCLTCGFTSLGEFF
jgi:hypothetical protein